MSGLFNLKVGGTAAEDIYCNGQAVEEVWVDGVQVFDAYDPSTVPDGSLALTVNNPQPASYNDSNGKSWYSTGQVGKQGYIYLTTNGGSSIVPVTVSGDGIPSNSQSLYWNGVLSLCYDGGSTLFYISIWERISGTDYVVEAFDSIRGSILTGNEGFTGGFGDMISWDFANRTVKVHDLYTDRSITQTLTGKWKPGMYVRYDVRSYNYSSSGNVGYIANYGGGPMVGNSY